MPSILPTVENACKLLVKDLIASQNLTLSTNSVYTGIDNDQKDLPEVICYAESAEQLYKDTDWWKVKTLIVVAHNAARSERETATYEANKIFDGFFDVSSSVYLSNITSSFTVADVLDRTYSSGIEQDAWIQTIGFTLIACPAS